MSRRRITNVAASVKMRLLNIAKKQGCTFNTLLIRYANERFLYRLGISEFNDDFILKGSDLFLIWQKGYPYRPTIDSDFLVLGRSEEGYLTQVFTKLCGIQPDVEDGMKFDATSIKACEIREEAQYGGTRITLIGTLGISKIHLQFDIGIGDVVTPGPRKSEYPALLDFKAPVLLVYPQETAIAEKVKTMVSLGMVNSRMKDFADILVLQRNFSFDYLVLQTAIRRTFARYNLELPIKIPTCFENEFTHSLEK